MPAMTSTKRSDAIKVPTWVPPEYQDVYRLIAATKGEEEAASIATAHLTGPRLMPMSNVMSFDPKRSQSMPLARDPPASLADEQALLGAILMNEEAFAQAASIAKPEHFSEEVHRRIFDIMGQLVRAGRPITPGGLITYLGDHDLGGGLSTRSYIARLAAEAITVIGAPEYARIVRDMAVRRELIESAHRLVALAHDARIDVSPDDVAAESLQEIRALLDQAPRHRSRFLLGDGMQDLVDRMERIRRGEEKPRSFCTGFPDLDRAIGGLQPGTIVVVGARVAMGKTVAMTNIAANVARHNADVGALEFSLEIPADQLQARHIAEAIYDRRRPLSFSSILSGQVDDFDAERIIIAQREFRALPIIVECPPRITAPEIAARIHIEKKAMATRGKTLGVVLIDYLDKVSASDRYAGQRTYEIQEVISILKSAALAEDVCIVLLTQLNRATEGREDKRPSLADLKSSSFIEQEAHAVIFIYREGYYLLKSPAYREQDADALVRYDQVQNDVEFIIGKNRGGPETTVHLWGDVACSIFASKAHVGRKIS